MAYICKWYNEFTGGICQKAYHTRRGLFTHIGRHFTFTRLSVQEEKRIEQRFEKSKLAMQRHKEKANEIQVRQ